MKPDKSMLTDPKDLKEDGNAYESLQRKSWERCEFCDLLFSNRYTMFQHNLTHIIIPLIKQNTYECKECLYHFTSLQALKSHNVNKHGHKSNYEEKLPEILQSIIEQQVVVKCEDDLKELLKSNEHKINGTIEDSFKKEPLESQIKEEMQLEESTHNFEEPTHDFQEPTHNFEEPTHDIQEPNHNFEEPTHDIQEPKHNFEESTHDIQEPNHNFEESTHNFDEPEDYDEPINLADLIKLEPSLKEEPSTDEINEPIHRRLLFEEDIEDNLFKDLSADCQVSLELLYEEINPKIDMLQTFGDINFEARDAVSKAQEDTTELLRFGKAIHYDVLLEEEVCYCRLCGRDFPNRFSLLQHEPSHISIKGKRYFRPPLCCICERYILGNHYSLRNHMREKHPEQYENKTSYSTAKCPKCNLKYHNYRRHLQLHHRLFKCSQCDVEYKSQLELLEHDCCVRRARQLRVKSTNSVLATPVMEICDMCFTFMKIFARNRQIYEVIGEKSQLGVQQICNKCNSKTFEVKLVRKRRMARGYKKPVVTEFWKPVTEFQRPVTEFQRPVTEFQRPVTEFQSPVTEFQRPVTEIQRPVTEIQRPLTEFQSPVTEFQRRVEYRRQRVKPISNAERLLKIQNRLKKIKMRNKF